MNFATAPGPADFAASVRAALGERSASTWRPGGAGDDLDPRLTGRLIEVGLPQAAASGHEFVAAAGLELGRALAPLDVLDGLVLPDHALAVDGVARYSRSRTSAVDVSARGARLVTTAGAASAPSLDDQGFVQLHGEGEAVGFPDLVVWARYHTAYLAGLADEAHRRALAYTAARKQFGRRLVDLPAVQAMLADAAALTDGLVLLAWEESADPWPPLVHAGEAACRVCEISQQVHGATGFVLETGLHAYFRRAHALRVFTGGAARATRAAERT